jgi:hypothetical protein
LGKREHRFGGKRGVGISRRTMYYGTFSAFSREMLSAEIVHILKNFGLIFKNAEIGGFHLRDTRKSFVV